MLVDVFAHRSFHAPVQEKGEYIPQASLKLQGRSRCRAGAE
jgi:iron(III) transport system substrate-binding protein